MVTLGEQTNQIQGQIDKTEGLTDKIKGARTILTRMSKRQVVTSIIFVIVILVLLAIIALIIFLLVRPYLPNLTGSGSGSK
jgi:uncharacterized phage infection (PIP) family protein YhgE